MTSEALIKLGLIARQRRKELGLTQAEASVNALAHRNDISEIERGQFWGSVVTVDRYLQCLQLMMTARPKQLPTLEELDELFGDDQ